MIGAKIAKISWEEGVGRGGERGCSNPILRTNLHTQCRSYPLQITCMCKDDFCTGLLAPPGDGVKRGGGVHVLCGLSEKCIFCNEVHKEIPESKLA
jgi:hypothetical protein